MCHVSLQEVTSRFVRRLSVRIQPSSIDRLAELVYADYAGRPPLPKEMPLIMERILEVAQEIEVDVEREDPLLMGRHLIEMGLTPGPIFGEILDAAYEAQLEEEFLDVEGAIRWFEEWRNG